MLITLELHAAYLSTVDERNNKHLRLHMNEFHKSPNNKKGRRAINFTEVSVLVDVVLKHAIKWKEKTATWNKVAVEHNNLTGNNTNRSAHELRFKYECTIKQIKKKQTQNKYELFKSGGSAATPTVDKLSNSVDVEEYNSLHCWAKWNAKQIKNPKHKDLIAKPTPIKKDTLNNKVSAVFASRQVLVLFQMDSSKKEEQRQQKEHTEKLRLLEHKIKNE
ncbi:hypothetical protein FQA39_LY18801 [Lamprigera yunnana]|nr:hypothetical protein FQA39_LY18801 [Lamprigera yunnana]